MYLVRMRSLFGNSVSQSDKWLHEFTTIPLLEKLNIFSATSETSKMGIKAKDNVLLVSSLVLVKKVSIY